MRNRNKKLSRNVFTINNDKLKNVETSRLSQLVVMSTNKQAD